MNDNQALAQINQGEEQARQMLARPPEMNGSAAVRPAVREMTIRDFAEAAVHSGMFKDLRNVAQAIVKMKTGDELGIPPMASLRLIDLIEGQPAIRAQGMAAMIKKSGRYTFRLQSLDDNQCSIGFYELTAPGEWTGLGVAQSTAKEAEEAGLLGKTNWMKWRQDMLYWRAMSRGARRFCPDVIQGLYTADELGWEMDPAGNPIQPPAAPAKPDRTAWHREAAKVIYPKVSPEVAEHIKRAGASPDLSADEFTRLLSDVAAAHAIALPTNQEHPHHDQSEQQPATGSEDFQAAAAAGRAAYEQAGGSAGNGSAGRPDSAGYAGYAGEGAA